MCTKCAKNFDADDVTRTRVLQLRKTKKKSNEIEHTDISKVMELQDLGSYKAP